MMVMTAMMIDLGFCTVSDDSVRFAYGLVRLSYECVRCSYDRFLIVHNNFASIMSIIMRTIMPAMIILCMPTMPTVMPTIILLL